MISFKGTYVSSFRDQKVKPQKKLKNQPFEAKNRKKIVYLRQKPEITKGPKQRAIVQIGHHFYLAALGRSGITTRKCEGDGATPRAEMRCLFGFWRGPRGQKPASPLRFLRAEKTHGWCDQSGNPNYNGPVKRPFHQSHETLRRDDRLYDQVVVLDWNIAPITGGRQRNRGSAIFLHVAKEGYQPTEGCIALYPKDLAHLLRRLDHHTYFKVV